MKQVNRSLLWLLPIGLLLGCPKQDTPPSDTQVAKTPATTKPVAAEPEPVAAKSKPVTADPAATSTLKKEMAPVTVLLKTSKGDIQLALDPNKAPKTVANFVSYVRTGFYDGTIFHRVIDNFMIQGGGFTADFAKKPTQAPVENEADNGLTNARGTIAMARTPDPNSATAQFFINVKDNTSLNHTSKTPQGWGYTVFGKVTSGMDVVDAIKSVATGARGPFSRDAPLDDVVIVSAKVQE